LEVINADLLCRVVDNFGDGGVCLRLARALRERGWNVRLYCDQPEVLEQIGATPEEWDLWDFTKLLEPSAQVLIECFSCGVPEGYWQSAGVNVQVHLNLDYLALEDWAKGCHGLGSPSGSPKRRKFYFAPGPADELGGLILDRGFAKQLDLRQNHLRELRRLAWSHLSELNQSVEPWLGHHWLFTFAYPRDWKPFVEYWLGQAGPALWVAAQGQVQTWWLEYFVEQGWECEGRLWTQGNKAVLLLPQLPQEQFQEWLLSADFATVRGEDSFARAILAGLPCLWMAYCQQERAHMDKVQGFLDCLKPFMESSAWTSYGDCLSAWNEREQDSRDTLDPVSYDLMGKSLASWADGWSQLGQVACQRWDLCANLINFVQRQLVQSATPLR
jgi:uncharacterized repeat protein (TIGR03837 family)